MTKNTNKIAIFTSEEFGQIRTIEMNGEPWFVGKDVAEALGYQNGSRDINTHVSEDDRKILTAQNYQNGTFKIPSRGLIVINESGLYALIFSSKLESAKRFKHWVTSEVLPSIRKNGGYIDGQETMSDEELLAKAVLMSQKIIEEKNKIIEKNQKKLAKQQPLVDFAVHVSQSKDTIDMGTMAKIAKNEQIDIGRNRLIKWLKDKKILRYNNAPYQKYIQRGYFGVIEVEKETSWGSRFYPKTVITGKGQLWLIKKLRNEYPQTV